MPLNGSRNDKLFPVVQYRKLISMVTCMWKWLSYCQDCPTMALSATAIDCVNISCFYILT